MITIFNFLFDLDRYVDYSFHCQDNNIRINIHSLMIFGQNLLILLFPLTATVHYDPVVIPTAAALDPDNPAEGHPAGHPC
jgi:hypothetical protein